MWRLAESLKQLQSELNSAFPNRSKISDGSIGDLSHSQRKSDHNPNAAGVVTAIDVTNDEHPNELAGQALADALYHSKDKRIKYLIWNKQITIQPIGSGWKDYHGINPHQHHVHISVSSDPKLYDDKSNWNLTFPPVTNSAVPAVAAGAAALAYTVKPGDTAGGIAKRFGIELKKLKELNNLNNAFEIKIGQTLKVK